MKDGHLNKCKKCSKKDSLTHRHKNIEYYRQYDRDRFKDDLNRRAKHNQLTKNQRIKYPEKYKARTAVSNAIRDGRLTKMSCCVCGDVNSTAHHEDYSKPLEVVWVCSKHHKEIE